MAETKDQTPPKYQPRIEISQLDKVLLLIQANLFTQLFGPRLVKLRHIINLFKGATFLWVIFLMDSYNNYSTGMYLYLFLHGSYGIAWVTKDIIFPDFRFNKMASLGSAIGTFVFLTLYWLIPIPLAAGFGVSQPSIARIIFLVVLYISGLVLMLGSDYQKYIALKQKPGLISTGFFKNTRNPNYLGQIMIYSSFVLCSGHLQGFMILYGLACMLFALNMYLKDSTSYRFKRGWQEYKNRSYILLPKLMPSLLLNCLLYITVFGCIALFLFQEQPQGFNDFSWSHLANNKMIQTSL